LSTDSPAGHLPGLIAASIAGVSKAIETAYRRGVRSADVLCLVVFAALGARFAISGLATTPALAAWTTVFAAICIQASPFLVLGVALSATLAELVPREFFRRALPCRPSLAVPVAGLAASALPGCECASVPVAASLMRCGVARGPTVAFLLSAPATNPVVLVATSVAFPGQPIVVLARLLASITTAIVVGWLWQRVGREVPISPRVLRPSADGAGAWQRARLTAMHDLAQAVGLLVVGAAAAATLNVAVPRSWLDALGGNAVEGVATLSVLAVVLAVCSEADAFVASSLSQFSMTARLAFMAVGPAVDIKLVAMQVGTFGRRFATRLAPLTLVVAAVAAGTVGTVLL
jgi:uncharacterized membrane protein YraQ (UPF0718 family)